MWLLSTNAISLPVRLLYVYSKSKYLGINFGTTKRNFFLVSRVSDVAAMDKI